ncbi:MAG TPA: zinc metalloprotease HtpX [Armatimonadota bacterium]|jgi:heat shock protein HtpX
MSTLARRSAIVLALLFGLVFAVGTGVMYYLEVPLSWAIVFAIAVVLLQFAIGPWIIELIFKIQWVDPAQVHPDFAVWLRETCATRRIPVPRFGVIQDGNPNAFTYGHTPKDARVVVTSGLLEMLDPEETHAVVAHELGHVRNYDFIVMTVAQLVPLILYYIYVFSRRRARGSREGMIAAGVAVGAYVAYIFSEYLVLFLSRVREYFADEASAETTHSPDALSSALVKIAYGLARNPRVQPQEEKGGKKKGITFDPGRATAAMGICNAVSSTSFAMAACGPDGQFSASAMTNAMQWDLKNPWGKWFELNSTHPLVARRVLAMNRMAKRLGVPTRFSVDPTSVHRVYTGNFMLEVAAFALPLLGALAGLGLGTMMLAATGGWAHYSLAVVGLGLGWLVKTAICYPAVHPQVRTVESLVTEEINVSHVHPLPCCIEGTIIGRGVPGLFYSSDLVLHDGTGFLTMIYRQPFHILEFLFGWLKGGQYQNRKARVFGWYRRGPSPWFEIQSVQMLDGPDGNVRCYGYWGTYISAILIAALGFLMLWAGTSLQF